MPTRHFTSKDVGKDVVDHNGEVIGTVAGVEDGEAILTSESGVAAAMEEAFSQDGDERLFVRPEQVEEVTDEWVRVNIQG